MSLRYRLDRRFAISASGSTLGRETLGGFTTFLSMAYIAVVNPVFLAAAGIAPDEFASGRAREAHWLVYAIALLFAWRYLFLN